MDRMVWCAVMLTLLVGSDAFPRGQPSHVTGPERMRKDAEDLAPYSDECAAIYPESPYACTDRTGWCMRADEICDGFVSCEHKGDEKRKDCDWGKTDDSGCTKPKQIGNKGVEDLKTQILEAQNYFRCLHGVPALVWDSKLETFAKGVARRNAAVGDISHTHDAIYGENIDMKELNKKEQQSGMGFTKNWYREIEDYNFGSPNPFGRTGHFTALIWKGTEKVGCEFADKAGSPFNLYVAVCNYEPMGNLLTVEAFSENIPPPL
ncbi:Golgi-associated plant pathogenesis-related protein 1-like [Glandiceps talaboti]